MLPFVVDDARQTAFELVADDSRTTRVDFHNASLRDIVEECCWFGRHQHNLFGAVAISEGCRSEHIGPALGGEDAVQLMLPCFILRLQMVG